MPDEETEKKSTKEKEADPLEGRIGHVATPPEPEAVPDPHPHGVTLWNGKPYPPGEAPA